RPSDVASKVHRSAGDAAVFARELRHRGPERTFGADHQNGAGRQSSNGDIGTRSTRANHQKDGGHAKSDHWKTAASPSGAPTNHRHIREHSAEWNSDRSCDPR